MNKEPAPRRASRAAPARYLAALATACITFAPLPGCISDDARARAAKSESIIPMFWEPPPSPVQAATWAADEYDADKRFRGTLWLANAPWGGEDVYIRLYVAHLTDSDAAVRAASARALGLHGTPDHAALIAPMLKDSDRLVRLEATVALQRLHNPVAVTNLLEATDRAREPEATVRAEAANALGQYAQRRVLQGLIATLADQSLTVSRNALESLRTLTGQDIPDDRRAWLAWADSTPDPFAGRREYVYPAFNRDRRWYEYLPFTPDPPNEPATTPAGMPPVEQRASREQAAD